MLKSECPTESTKLLNVWFGFQIFGLLSSFDIRISSLLVCSLNSALLAVTSWRVARFQKEKGEGHHARSRPGYRRPQTRYHRTELRPAGRKQGNARRND